MKIKTLLVAVIGMSVLSGVCRADKPADKPAGQTMAKPDAGQNHLKQALSAVADELKFTEKQRAEAVPILENTIKEAKDIVSSGAAPLDKRDKLMALRKNSHDQLASILTAQQLDELEVKRDVIRQQVQAALWGQRAR